MRFRAHSGGSGWLCAVGMPELPTHAWQETGAKRPFKRDKLTAPSPDITRPEVDRGPFSVLDQDKNPCPHDEADWIRASIANDIPLPGNCQGAHQIACTLGARSGPYDTPVHEFGYYPVSPTPEGREFLPETLNMTQAHFHTFDIPQGAVHLAYSPLNPKQAVRHGDKTYAFQHHPECTIEGFERCWPNASAHCGMSGAQSREEQAEMMALDDAKQADWFYDAQSKLFGTP